MTDDRRHIDFSNYHFDITDDQRLQAWIELCAGSREAAGWRIVEATEDRPARIVFYWHEPDEGFNAFPFKGQPRQIAMLAQWWLEDEAKYPIQPGHDGSSERGFRIFNEECGHVDGSPYGFMAIEPAWAEYGK